MANLLSLSGTRSVVATRRADAGVVGSVFVHDRWPVAAIGPITVDPGQQNRGVGRALLDDVMAWSAAGEFPSIRLVQAAYHSRSLSLYTSLGFDAREPLSVLQGPPLEVAVPERVVRPATSVDLEACNELCTKVHGFARTFETERVAPAPDEDA